MSTETVEKPVLQSPPKGVTFLARREDLTLVRTAVKDIRDSFGERVDQTPEDRFYFRSGILTVGSSKKDDLAWLRSHHLFGNREEGFWEHHEPAPDVSEQETSLLTSLSVNGDLQGLAEFVAAEERGWAREALLTPARQAFRTIKERVEAEPKGVGKPRKLPEIAGEG